MIVAPLDDWVTLGVTESCTAVPDPTSQRHPPLVAVSIPKMGDTVSAPDPWVAAA